MPEDLKVNSNTDILEFKRKFNLFVSNYDKGEFDGDFEITGDLTVDGDVEIKGDLVGAETQIANAVSTYITAHPFAPEMLEGQDISPDDISATGNITANSIVENMTGYSFWSTAEENLTKVVDYAGVVKNGNKVTFVVALRITPTDESYNASIYMGTFGIPQAVADKLIPTTIGGYGFLDVRKGLVFDVDSAFGNAIDKIFYAQKATSSINLRAYLPSLTIDHTYYLRYELTFLLSDSLSSNE